MRQRFLQFILMLMLMPALPMTAIHERSAGVIPYRVGGDQSLAYLVLGRLDESKEHADAGIAAYEEIDERESKCYCENVNGMYQCLCGCKDDSVCAWPPVDGGPRLYGRCCTCLCIDANQELGGLQEVGSGTPAPQASLVLLRRRSDR
jgi:hypothetical protein